MPRKELIEYECDRCGRKWYPEVDEGTAGLLLKLTHPEGVDQELCYEVLCTSCEKAVAGYIESIGKLQHQSPKRGERKARKKGGPATPEVLPEKGKTSK